MEEVLPTSEFSNGVQAGGGIYRSCHQERQGCGEPWVQGSAHGNLKLLQNSLISLQGGWFALDMALTSEEIERGES